MGTPDQDDAGSLAVRRQLLDKVDDAKITAIIETGASLAEIEQALVWATGESAVGEDRHPLDGVVARVYEILMADDDVGEER